MRSPETALPSHIIFARHGRHGHNVRLALTGKAAMDVTPLRLREHQTSPLDEVGREQAVNLGNYLRSELPLGALSVAMCSDFLRTRETALLALPTIKHLIEEEALRERYRGKVADIPKDQFRELWPEEFEKRYDDPAA